jgi:limonene-1,2-epoxide hydrolase
MDVREVIIAFNDAIGRADLAALAEHVAPDHAFIDAAGNSVTGREMVLAAWRGFFAAFPGYRNRFDEIRVAGPHVMIRGISESDDPALAGPALWRAEVVDGLVTLWEVHADTAENRTRLGLDRHADAAGDDGA